MLESRMIEYCAPTLAGMKSANLFNYFFTKKEDVLKELNEMNEKLNIRGVYVEAMKWKENSVLIYTYRKSHLSQELKKSGVRELLSVYGYEDDTAKGCLLHLKERLCYSDVFPHEIGIFLGYPLPDVIGFIHHKGQNCKYCGMWKVYGNELEAIRLFERLKKCTDVYLQVFAKGRSITQMTVIA